MIYQIYYNFCTSSHRLYYMLISFVNLTENYALTNLIKTKIINFHFENRINTCLHNDVIITQ